MTLEELLRKHFNLKGKFLLKKTIREDDRNYLTTCTKTAGRAYSRMTKFLYDLALSGLCTDTQADEIIKLVDNLDELFNEN